MWSPSRIQDSGNGSVGSKFCRQGLRIENCRFDGGAVVWHTAVRRAVWLQNCSEKNWFVVEDDKKVAINKSVVSLRMRCCNDLFGSKRREWSKEVARDRFYYVAPINSNKDKRQQRNHGLHVNGFFDEVEE